MAYVLVFLHASANAEQEQQHAASHERFIDSLVARNLVLLGGAFAAPIGDAYAAYVLRADLDEARQIAAQDPFVVDDVLRAELVQWELVGINPEAIDPSAVIRPVDVG